jgi:hypothetical protein
LVSKWIVAIFPPENMIRTRQRPRSWETAHV